LLGEFQCSYAGDLIVSNGSLFLSTNHLVFYSSLGALSVKKLVIPWLSVRSIELSVTNYDVSSGIKVLLKDNQLRHFTQFVSRDSVYELMVRIWTRAKQNAEVTSSDPDTDSKPLVFEGHLGTSSGGHSNSSSSPLMAEVAAAAGGSPPSSSSSIPSGPSSFSGPTSAIASGSLSSSSSGVIGPPPNLTGAQPVPTITVAISEDWVEPSSEPAEKPVVLPVGIEEFEKLFLDDDGAFFNAFHSEAGLGGPDNCWIKPYPKTEVAGCFSREFNFQQPITTSFPLAPATTRVKQVHRWFWPSRDSLYFSTSSMMPDIPYGSSFSIESKWKVKRVDAQSCMVTCYVEASSGGGLFFCGSLKCSKGELFKMAFWVSQHCRGVDQKGWNFVREGKICIFNLIPFLKTIEKGTFGSNGSCCFFQAASSCSDFAAATAAAAAAATTTATAAAATAGATTPRNAVQDLDQACDNSRDPSSVDSSSVKEGSVVQVWLLFEAGHVDDWNCGCCDAGGYFCVFAAALVLSAGQQTGQRCDCGTSQRGAAWTEGKGGYNRTPVE
jgi:hypothetical protein